MKRQYIFGTMLSIALTAAVAAQEPAVGARPPAQSGSDSPQTVTMTGCLQSASAAGSASSTSTGSTTAGTAGAATSGGSSATASRTGSYILTNAAMASAAGAAGTAGTAGTAPAAPATATPGASSSATTYRLMGGPDQNLQQYVGQKVEVTGSVTARGTGSPSGAAGATGAPAAGAGAGSTAAPGSMAPGAGPAFRVSSVKPTGERCGG